MKKSPIYILNGDESYLIHQFMQSLTHNIGSEEEAEYIHLDLNDVSVTEVLDEADSFSFFADQRVVIVRNANLLSSSPQYSLTDREKLRLEDYFNHPNEYNVLVLYQGDQGIDKRKKISKIAMKQGYIVDVTAPSDQEVANILSNYIQQLELKMEDQAFRTLLDRVSYQLSNGIHEIEKLKTYSLSHKPITVAIIESLVARTIESDIFQLTNALTAKDYARTIQIYEDLILMKHDPVAIHALMTSQFRVLLQSSLLMSQGYSQGDIAKYLNIHPYRVKLAMQSVQRMDIAYLKQFYLSMIETDYQMKSGIGLKETHFYILLTRLNHLYQ